MAATSLTKVGDMLTIHAPGPHYRKVGVVTKVYEGEGYISVDVDGADVFLPHWLFEHVRPLSPTDTAEQQRGLDRVQSMHDRDAKIASRFGFSNK